MKPIADLGGKLPTGGAGGYYDPRFEAVAAAFLENFASFEEVGAGVAVTVEGSLVLDLWGGLADAEEARPWTEDTLSIIHSTTKAAAAICMHMLLSRGALKLDVPVASYWPEFAANGKEAVTVRMVLDHSAGVPCLRDPVKEDALLDWDYMVRRIAEEAPHWTPGARSGYHGFTFGFLTGELIKRTTGRTLGTFFQEEVAQPLGLDFWIGLPEELDPRVTKIIEPDMTAGPYADAEIDPASITGMLILNSGRWDSNDPAFRRGEIPSSNGITNASSLARLFAPFSLDGSIDGNRFVEAAWADRMSEVSMATHCDASVNIPVRYGYGFSMSVDHRGRVPGSQGLLMGRRAFGHPGKGGIFGCADPECRMSFGYLMNRLGTNILIEERGQRLLDAVYKSLGYADNAQGFWRKA